MSAETNFEGVLNSRGLERRDNLIEENRRFDLYVSALQALIPVNTEERAAAYRAVLLEHQGIRVTPDGMGGFATHDCQR